MGEARLPLEGLFVLDLTRARAGPTAVRHLADWGAEVIKIEAPGDLASEGLGGDRNGPDFLNLHRNKRSMTLNLKSDAGYAIFLALAERADVVVENFRAAVKHRLKIDYDTLAARNPRLIYGSISGFGQDRHLQSRLRQCSRDRKLVVRRIAIHRRNLAMPLYPR